MALLITSVVVALVVSAVSSSSVGTLKPVGQMSFAPPSVQALILLLPVESAVLQSPEEVEEVEVVINLFIAGVMVVANVAVMPEVLDSCPSSFLPHW